MLESRNFELIDALLHREDPTCPGHWCLVVPKELLPQLLEETHAGLFAGHFSEKSTTRFVIFTGGLVCREMCDNFVGAVSTVCHVGVLDIDSVLH